MARVRWRSAGYLAVFVVSALATYNSLQTLHGHARAGRHLEGEEAGAVLRGVEGVGGGGVDGHGTGVGGRVGGLAAMNHDGLEAVVIGCKQFHSDPL